MEFDEIDKMINERIEEKTKFWTQEDHDLINEAMKGIFDLPIGQAVMQAQKWAYLMARASVVKMETEEERKKWFDEEISTLDYSINTVYKNNEG